MNCHFYPPVGSTQLPTHSDQDTTGLAELSRYSVPPKYNKSLPASSILLHTLQMCLVIQCFCVSDLWLAVRHLPSCFSPILGLLFPQITHKDRSCCCLAQLSSWSGCQWCKTCVCVHVNQGGGICADTRHLPITHGSTHTHSVPGAEWYGVPASDLLSHYMFVLLYLQTIHWTDLSGEESAPQAWIITSLPGASCSWFGWRFPSCHEGDVTERHTDLPSAPVINPPPVWI